MLELSSGKHKILTKPINLGCGWWKFKSVPAHQKQTCVVCGNDFQHSAKLHEKNIFGFDSRWCPAELSILEQSKISNSWKVWLLLPCFEKWRPPLLQKISASNIAFAQLGNPRKHDLEIMKDICKIHATFCQLKMMKNPRWHKT